MHPLLHSQLGQRVIAIHVRDVTWGVGARELISNVGFDVASGMLFGIAGAVGAGKTSLLELLHGKRRPWQGTIEVLGLDPESCHSELAAQIDHLQPTTIPERGETAAQFMLRYVKERSGANSQIGAAIEAAIDELALQNVLCREMASLTPGYRRRVELAARIAGRPEVLLIDELSIRVDAESRKRLWETVIASARRGTTCVCSLHHQEDALRCDRIAYLFRGQLLKLGSPEDLISAGCPQGSRWLAATCDHVRRARRLLWKLPGVQAVSAHGREIRVLIDNRVTGAQLRARLSSAAIELKGIHSAVPTLHEALAVQTTTLVPGPD
ncbi:MAG: ATP-binding cassette domain-containing protein [Pirellulales bacterium]